MDNLETDELEPNPTVHSYVNQLLELTGKLMEQTRDSPVYDTVDNLTKEMDEILIEMRHANWIAEVG